MANPIQFIKEAKAELTKVVWPTRQEVLKITISVVVLCVFMAAFLGLVDFGLLTLIEKFINRQ